MIDRRKHKSTTAEPQQESQSPVYSRFIQGFTKSKAALHNSDSISRSQDHYNQTPLIFLNSYETKDSDKLINSEKDPSNLKVKCEELEEINRNLRMKLGVNNKKISQMVVPDSDVAEEGSAQCVHSPVVRRGKSGELIRGTSNDMNEPLKGTVVAKQLIFESNQYLYQKLDETSLNNRAVEPSLKDEKYATELEFRVKAEIIKNQETQIQTQKKEIESLEKQLEKAIQDTKDNIVLKSKIEIMRQKKFILNQDLNNANNLIEKLQDKLDNYEVKNENPAKKALNELSYLILSKRPENHHHKTFSLEEDALLTRMKSLEIQKEDLSEKYKGALYKSHVALSMLQQADEQALHVLELLEMGNFNRAHEDLSFRRNSIYNRLTSTQQELDINEEIMNSDEIIDRSFSTSLSFATNSRVATPLGSPQNGSRLRRNNTNAEREMEENRYLNKKIEDLEEKLEMAEIKAEVGANKD